MKYNDIINYYESRIVNLNNTKDPKARFVTSSYRKFINVIKDTYGSTTKITSKSIDALNISDHMKSQLHYFLENPNELSIISPNNNVKIQLMSLLGIGSVKADELISAGLKTIDQLKMKKYQSMLPDVAKKMLEFTPDRIIPRENIKKVEPFLLSLCDPNDNCISSIILGSYRRNMPTSRDIDLMIVSDDKNILKKFLARANKTFGETNVIPYAIGDDKISILIRFDNIESLKNSSKSSSRNLGVYKVDVFRATSDRAHAMQLYATGSKEFNIVMRKNAKANGMLLNQDGLYDRRTNKLIHTTSERDIFKKINMSYKEPHERK